MTDARLSDNKSEPKAGLPPRMPQTPYVDPRTFDQREDLVGEGMSPLPVIAGLLVTAAIVAAMFVLAA
jgi:hypothetical protein